MLSTTDFQRIALSVLGALTLSAVCVAASTGPARAAGTDTRQAGAEWIGGMQPR